MKTFFALISTTLSILFTVSASAQALDWDGNASGGASLGGSGYWNTTSPLWFNQSTDIPWVNNDDAIFSGALGTVTLTQNIGAGDLYFTNLPSGGGMVITNATGVETLTLANGVVDTGGTTDTISALLAGPLIKDGNGTLILGGGNPGLTSVTVNQGAVQVALTNAPGIGAITVTNGGSFEVNAGGTISNSFFVSGSGVNGEGALFNVANAVPTHSGLITIESTNVVFGGNTGTYYLEGGITNASGNNGSVVFAGGATFRVSYNATTKPVDFGSNASITVSAIELNVEATTLVYSNLILNGGQFASSLSDKSFGLSPSAFEANNITMSNGANMTMSHTFTFGGNRGIYLGPGGGDIGENTGSGTLSIPGAISGPGTLLIEYDGTSAGVKFTGNNTFTGTCTVAAGATLTVTGTFGAGDTVNNGVLSVDRGGTYTYAGAISGSGTNTFESTGGVITFSGPISTTGPFTLNSASGGTLVLSGPVSTASTPVTEGAGTIIFSGANTYPGNTLIQNQYFMVKNTSGSGTSSGTVTVGTSSGGTFLGGTGIISGPVTVVAGNTLQPGFDIPTNSVGTLTINNSLTLQSGSATIMNIDAQAHACSAVVGMTSVTYGGTLTVNIINGSPEGGQTYQLFGAGSYSGTFDGGISLPTLPSGMSWNTSNLSVNGTISIVTQNGIFNKPVISGNNLILSGTEGTASGTYSVLSTTNLTLPISSWTVVSTGNSFDSSGNFSFTNAINANTPYEYFMIRQP